MNTCPDSDGEASERTCRVVVADDGSIGCYGLVAALAESDLVETVRIDYMAQKVLESVQRVTPDAVILPLGEDGTVSLIRQVRDVSAGAAAVLVVGESGPPAGAAVTGATETLSWRASALDVSLAVVAATEGQPAPAAEALSAADALRLSARELEVMRLAAEGLTNSSAARALSLSESTVKTYWRRIFRKFDVHDRTTAVAAAMSMGMLPARPPGSRPRLAPFAPSASL